MFQRSSTYVLSTKHGVTTLFGRKAACLPHSPLFHTDAELTIVAKPRILQRERTPGGHWRPIECVFPKLLRQALTSEAGPRHCGEG